jgi:hypothetical protein
VDEDGECVIATQDNDDWIIATVHGDYAEQFAELWAGAGPQVAELVAEVERLRAIARGRTVAPTDEEFRLHVERGGEWYITPPPEPGARAEGGFGGPLHTEEWVAYCRSIPGTVWLPMRDGRPCAWPVVEVSRG